MPQTYSFSTATSSPALRRHALTNTSGTRSGNLPVSRRESRYLREQLNREFVNSTKLNQPCADCGIVYYDEPFLMDYHHVDPSSKLFPVSDPRSRSRAKILDEISKCVLLCAICHRRRHQYEEAETTQNSTNQLELDL